MFEFNNIVKKFNYDSDFSLFLHQVYCQLVAYYGNEYIVYNAFYNTEVRSTSSIYDFLSNNDFIQSGLMVTESDLKRSSGIYISKPLIVFDGVKYDISDVKRFVLVKNFDLNDVVKKATLIHELCHMVKSFENEYRINGDVLIENSGLIERNYKLSFNSGNVELRIVRECGVGFEEGFTTLAEEDITRNIVDCNYSQSGYGAVCAAARNLMKYVNESIIKYAQMHHDKDVIYQKINNYNEIEGLIDLVYRLNLNMYASAFDKQRFEKEKELIFSVLNNYCEKLELSSKRNEIIK